MSIIEFPEDGYFSKTPTQTASLNEKLYFLNRNINSTTRTRFLCQLLHCDVMML